MRGDEYRQERRNAVVGNLPDLGRHHGLGSFELGESPLCGCRSRNYRRHFHFTGQVGAQKFVKALLLLGIALILLGSAILGYHQFHYKTEEKVLDFGPIHATAERIDTVFIPPLTCILCCPRNENEP